jgi:hypothetical protein
MWEVQLPGGVIGRFLFDLAHCMPHWISPDIGQVGLLPGTYRIPAAAAPLLRATLLDRQVCGLLPYALLGVGMQDLACSAGGRGVGKQGDLARVLDRDRDVALVLSAVPGDAAGPDLAAVGEVFPQQAGVLVVDVLSLVLAERAHLLLRRARDGLGHGYSLVFGSAS